MFTDRRRTKILGITSRRTDERGDGSDSIHPEWNVWIYGYHGLSVIRWNRNVESYLVTPPSLKSPIKQETVFMWSVSFLTQIVYGL